MKLSTTNFSLFVLTTFFSFSLFVFQQKNKVITKSKMVVSPDLTLNTIATNSECAEDGSGNATVYAKGGGQANGLGRFTAMNQTEFLNLGERARAADLDGDGDLDIVAGQGGTPNTIYLNNGDATFIETFAFDQTAYSQNYAAFDIGDVDGDGDIDLFSINPNSELVVYFNDGNANFTAGTPFHFNRRKFASSLGDLDGDGDLDAFVLGHGANASTPEIRIWLNDGTGSFTQSTEIYQTFNNGSFGDTQLGDLDGDGDIDAFVTSNNNLAQVWLNDGDATFTQSTETYSTVNNFIDFSTLGDLDGDGDLDVVISKHTAPSEVYLNDSDGTFTLSVETYGDNCCGSGEVELADFTGDGILDMAIARVGNNSSMVYSGDGDGTFTIVEDLSTIGGSDSPARSAIAVVAGDFDGDADIDVGFGSHFGVVSMIALNDQRRITPYTYQWDDPSSQTTATATNLLPGTYNVTVTDLDGVEEMASVTITAPDIIEASITSTLASCMPGNDATATATGSGGIDFSYKPNGEDYLLDNEIASSISLGDLDGDGDLDIFDTNFRTSGVDKPDRVWFNDGDGTFTQSTENYAFGTVTVKGELGDLDGDGDLDVFQSGVATQVVLHNDGDGTFTHIETFNKGYAGSVGQFWDALDLGDIDGDGHLDAVVGAAGAYQAILAYTNDGDGTFTPGFEQAIAEPVDDLKLGDLDGDGDLDMFVTGAFNVTTVYFNDGTGQFMRGTETYGLNNRWEGIGMADFDSDGDLDMFLTNHTGMKNLVLHNNGDGTFTEVQSNFGEYGVDVSVGDIDMDGDLDVFTAGYDQGSKVYLNDGSGIFMEYFPDYSRFGGYQSSALGDLDGDGDLDAIVGHFGRLDVLLHEPNCYDYKWSDASGQTTATATGLSPGTYTVTVTDTRGCTTTESVVINANTTVPAISAIDVQTCAGDTLKLKESSGVATSWSWTGPNGFSSSDQNPKIPDATTNMTGNYTVSITDANACANSKIVSVTVYAKPAITVTNPATCSGIAFDLTTTSVTDANASGGTITYHSGTPATAANQLSSTMVNPSTTITYYALSTTANNCTDEVAFQVMVNENLILSTTDMPKICLGNSFDLSTLTIVDGLNSNPTFTYHSATPATVANQITATVSPTTNTTYYILGTNANNCKGETSVEVAVKTLPDISTSNTTICYGGPFDLSDLTVLDANNQNGVLTYHSASPATTSNQLPSSVVGPTSTTTYYILSTSALDCTDETSTTITVRPNPDFAFQNASQVNCAGVLFDLDTVTIEGTATIMTKTWHSESSVSEDNELTNLVVSPESTTTYYALLTDENECARVLPFTLEVTCSLNIVDPCSCTDPLNIVLPSTDIVTHFHDVLTVNTGVANQTIALAANSGDAFLDNDLMVVADNSILGMTDASGALNVDFFKESGASGSITVSNGTFTHIFPLPKCEAKDCQAPIPTMNQWGLFIFALLLINLSLIMIREKEQMNAGG